MLPLHKLCGKVLRITVPLLFDLYKESQTCDQLPDNTKELQLTSRDLLAHAERLTAGLGVRNFAEMQPKQLPAVA